MDTGSQGIVPGGMGAAPGGVIVQHATFDRSFNADRFRQRNEID